MKASITSFLFLLFATVTGQVTYSSIASGEWHNPLIWNTGIVPSHTAHVHISAQTLVKINSAAECNNICIYSDGTLEISNALLTVKGSWDNSGEFKAGRGKVSFNGLIAQNIGGTVTTVFHNLEINNPKGVSLVQDQCVEGVLNLAAGKLSAGNKKLILLSNRNATAVIGQISNGAAISGNLYRERYMRFLPAGHHLLSAEPGEQATDWLHDSANITASHARLYTVENGRWQPVNDERPMNIKTTGQAPTCSYKTNGKAIVTVSVPERFNVTWFDMLGNKMTTRKNVYRADTLKNLAPGRYPLTITVCGEFKSEFLDTAEVGETMPIAPNAMVKQLLYGSDTSASVDVTATTGGNAPYSYKWSDGQQSSIAKKLTRGYHSLVITDSKGCTDTSFYVVRKIKMESLGIKTVPFIDTINFSSSEIHRSLRLLDPHLVTIKDKENPSSFKQVFPGRKRGDKKTISARQYN